MKNKFIILFCCLIMFGCKKNPFDYRNKYLGNYNFVVHETAWVLAIGTTLDTTFSYNGKVSYGSDEHTVLINFSKNVSIEPVIYEDGYLEVYGEFESTKRVSFGFRSGGLGGGSTWNVTGEKTK